MQKNTSRPLTWLRLGSFALSRLDEARQMHDATSPSTASHHKPLLTPKGQRTANGKWTSWQRSKQNPPPTDLKRPHSGLSHSRRELAKISRLTKPIAGWVRLTLLNKVREGGVRTQVQPRLELWGSGGGGRTTTSRTWVEPGLNFFPRCAKLVNAGSEVSAEKSGFTP